MNKKKSMKESGAVKSSDVSHKANRNQYCNTNQIDSLINYSILLFVLYIQYAKVRRKNFKYAAEEKQEIRHSAD